MKLHRGHGVIQRCFHACLCSGLCGAKKQEPVYLFPFSIEIVHTLRILSMFGVMLKTKSHISLALSPLCCCATSVSLMLFELGAIYCTKSSSAPTQKRQALLMLSQPLNYFRPLPRRNRDGIELNMMKQRAWWDYIQLCGGKWKNKLKRISNPIPNVDCIDWALGTNRHLMYSQTWRKKITFEL